MKTIHTDSNPVIEQKKSSIRGVPLTAKIAAVIFAYTVALDVSAFEAPADGVYKDRVDWGVMMDLSGPASGSQAIWTKGFQAFIRKQNEGGGVHGRRVNVLAEDSRFNPAQDKINYEKLDEPTPEIPITGVWTTSFS